MTKKENAFVKKLYLDGLYFEKDSTVFEKVKGETVELWGLLDDEEVKYFGYYPENILGTGVLNKISLRNIAEALYTYRDFYKAGFQLRKDGKVIANIYYNPYKPGWAYNEIIIDFYHDFKGGGRMTFIPIENPNRETYRVNQVLIGKIHRIFKRVGYRKNCFTKQFLHDQHFYEV